MELVSTQIYLSVLVATIGEVKTRCPTNQYSVGKR